MGEFDYDLGRCSVSVVDEMQVLGKVHIPAKSPENQRQPMS